MKNDFTDLHNEFRDNLKKINQQQLDENFVQLIEQQLNEVGSRPSLYDSPGNKFAKDSGIGGDLKRAGSSALNAVGRGIKKLPKGRVNLGKMLLDPGSYAKEYDPEELLKKGVTKAGYWAQSKISGTAAFIGNKIFGVKEREYRNYVKNGINKDRKRLTAQLNAMKKLRGLSSQRMARELQKALAEYLSTKKYDKIIKLKVAETKKKIDADVAKGKIKSPTTSLDEPISPEDFSESVLNEIANRTIKGRLGTQFRANHALGSDENKEALKIIGQHQNNLRGAIEIYIREEEKLRIDERAKKAIMYHAIEYCVARVFEKYLPEQIFLSGANPVLEYNAARKKDYKTLKDPTVFFPTWMLYIQESLRPDSRKKEEDREKKLDKETDKEIKKSIQDTEDKENREYIRKAEEQEEKEAKEREERDKELKKKEDERREKKRKDKEERRKEYERKREEERNKAQLDLFGEAAEQLGLFDDEEKKARQKEKEAKEQEKRKEEEEQEKHEASERHTERLPTFKQMIEFASKLRSFRTISTFVNYDNIVNHIKTELKNLEAREAGLAGSDRANYFTTPLQKIDSKLKAIAKGISARELKLNQMRTAFANWDDEDKKQHEEEYKKEYEKIRTERNNMANTYKIIKARRSKFLDGEDLTQSELDDLENLKPEEKSDKENDKDDKKSKEEEEVSMSAFRDLLDVVRASAYDGRLDMNAVQAAEIMATKVSNKTGKKLADLTQMLQQAKDAKPEKTQTASYEFQMKDFDYLAEKFIQKESSPLLESMPMIRFRRNPREGTSKIVMVCGKDEFKKSLNKTINVAGKKVKDVMCLPKQLKSAKERLKDRKASIKRWRKIRVNSVTVEKMNRKKQETKKASRTLRK